MDIPQCREVFWKQVRQKLESLALPPEHKSKVEEEISQRVPRNKSFNSRQSLTSKETAEWYTPPQYIALALQVMGEIDLDPASNTLAQQWIKATNYYTEAEDGLTKSWQGRVWLNPPYCGKTTKWVNKAIEEFNSDRMIEAILLVKPASGTKWYQILSKRFPRCEPDKRIRFLDSKGKEQPRPVHGNAFFYMGNKTEAFTRIFGQLGSVTVPAVLSSPIPCPNH